MKKDLEAQQRAIRALEDAAEVTGVHSTEELKGKYYEKRRELESLQATIKKVAWAIVAGLGGALVSAVGKKLGWL